MKGKKLLSMLTAGVLSVTMVMPAMAANTGTFDVTLTTKTGVLRVEVPTTLAVAVDQFELGNAGTQISSAPFTMVNKSQMDVKVEVDSEATVDTNVDLKGKVSEVEAAEAGDNFAWLGVAAMTAKDTYFAAKGSFADLNENSANVAAFDPTNSNTASQTFYLAKASGDKACKAITGVTGTNISYAQVNELEEVTFTSTDDTAKQAELDALIAGQDIYVFTPASGGTVANGDTGKLVQQGTTPYPYAAAEKYYKVKQAVSDPTTGLTAATLYAYAEMAGTDGGAAGFRYIGKLSNTKESWDKDDISKIGVTYTITSISPDSYNENKDNCVYGLYMAPIFAAGGTKGTITYTTSKVKEVTKIEMTNDKGTFDAMVDKGTIYSKATSAADELTDTTTITLDAKYVAFYSGNVAAKITYKDASGTTRTQTLKLNMD